MGRSILEKVAEEAMKEAYKENPDGCCKAFFILLGIIALIFFAITCSV